METSSADDRSSESGQPQPQSVPEDPSTEYDFSIEVLDIFSLDTIATIKRSSEDSTAAAIVESGFIPPTPYSPSLLVSVKTLELFRRLRLRKPSFSVEAFAKVVCDFYNMPYRYRFRNALAESFDVYLWILREIDAHIKTTLHQDSPDWRALHSCPPCSYELEGEPALKFRRMIVIDGNNSLKRTAHVGHRQTADTRTFDEGDYFLAPQYIDQFANEVRSRPLPPTDREDMEDLDSLSPAADGATPCADNWKAAAATEHKKMWAVFEETGIFACACRHGFMLWIADMIRSGELAKYPLAMVAKALETLGSDILMGYDIGCSFSSTLAHSSLSSKAQELWFRLCVNAFHGYSHNYACQMKNHPNIIEGMGLEDLETLEHIFSSSNQLARIIRYSSAFQRRLYIDTYFHQWDEDKYLNLGQMLLNNYKQALLIKSEESAMLAETMQSANVTYENLAEWKEDQQHYFATLGQEPEYNVVAIEYVELAKMQTTSSRFLTTTATAYNLRFADTGYGQAYGLDLSTTRKLETERRFAREQYQSTLQDVIAMEVSMGIDKRWEPADKTYLDTVKYMHLRRYHRALETLQKLVIQRLFELHKMNLSGTGYKLRTHIAKSLQTRCKAIQRAVNAYNSAALELDPPRPTLDWSQVSHYSFLEDFDLLRSTRQDIRAKPWAQPLFREMIKRANRLQRAEEEILRCNIESRCLLTSIADEECEFDEILSQAEATHDPHLGALHDHIIRRRRINCQVLARIGEIHRLEGFSGDTSIGVKKGSLPVLRSTDPGITNKDHGDKDVDEVSDDGDEVNGEVDRLMDFIADLAT
ncbi:hypothetical protein PLEOSDRAFT_1032013 [Pleurotus ostreatus PC15]|uniref:CxC1-like cysteine cluster associated with KDZ transposases domain-containing protein n=1 Tax=Pleurotus ostreatus (strain PC15) TaxID=1137138 RepID=A0A067P1I5_PLEO1|nr:hypothetical protein PLEOSDRAFT_1032013 [Pleurotus ostreatus PC15]